jgi:diguanylate cyclase (GGDEF)-like protein
MIDADHFKAVNDAHGHAVGDLVLQDMAAICRLALRAGDYLGRIGGEEFAAILPETGYHEAFEVAERLRRAIAETPVSGPAGDIRMTASFGAATLARPLDFASLLAAADAALYGAKSGGRNRTVIHRVVSPLERLARRA